MATVTIKINNQSDVGKYLIGLAKELAKNSKAVIIEENKVDFINNLSKKTNKNLTKKLFEKHNISYSK